MSKIPTAREFYDGHYSDDPVVIMIDFAKLHAEATLKAVNDMEKEFVPYEEALAFKELGFDEPCFAWYNDKNIRISDMDGCVVNIPIKNSSFTEDDEFVAGPTFSQAFRWFREKHKLPSHIHTIWQRDWNNYSYQWHIVENNEEWNSIEHFKTYEKAELACLRKLIEIVKNEKLNQSK